MVRLQVSCRGTPFPLLPGPFQRSPEFRKADGTVPGVSVPYLGVIRADLDMLPHPALGDLAQSRASLAVGSHERATSPEIESTSAELKERSPEHATSCSNLRTQKH